MYGRNICLAVRPHQRYHFRFRVRKRKAAANTNSARQTPLTIMESGVRHPCPSCRYFPFSIPKTEQKTERCGQMVN